MRLFVGIEIAPPVAAAAIALVDVLRERAATLAPRSRISWVTRDRLHVTVRFIGHIDDGRLPAIVDALRPRFAVEPFDVMVTGAGAFPSKGPPRVVWAGLSTGRDHLTLIEQEVSERLAAAGVARDDRPFTPHLTLGRVREAGRLRSRALLEGLGERALGSTSVDAITLFESRLSPKGPAYLAIHRTPLA